MSGTPRPRPSRPRLRRSLHLAAVTVGAATVASWSLGPTYAAAGSADTGDIDVVNTETVQVYADATGVVDTERVYEQLELSGEGSITLSNPVALDGLRNLDGFGALRTEGGSQVTSTTVDGVEQVRTVSDHDGELPVEVDARYELDGESVDPEDVVGESGHLVVEYTVANVSAVPTEITYDDGRGGSVTETVPVPVPMVGSLTTVAPPGFDEVTSAQANMAGDGKGGTKLSFTTTLIPPIGPAEATFGYEAEITDGVVPRADFTALPVNPLKSPSFARAATSYQGGATTGVALADGASTIDENLLKLRDGAGDLLAGLIKLRAGSEELSAGLVDKAAPGAAELAAGLSDEAAPGAAELAAGLNDDAAPGAALLAGGAGELGAGLDDLDAGAGRLSAGATALDVGVGVLADGTGTLRVGALELVDGARRVDAGAGDLAAGAGRLAAGSGDALGGSQQLTAGLGRLSDGLEQLGSLEGLPKAQAGATALKAGIDALVAGLGDASQPTSLVGGLTTLASPEGLPAAVTGAQQVQGGLAQLRGGPDSGLGAAKGGVDAVRGQLAPLAEGGLDQLVGTLGNAAATPGCQASPVCAGSVDGVISRLNGLKPQLLTASGALGQVSAGLGTAIGSLDTALLPGAARLTTSLQGAADGATRLRDGATAARTGALQIQAGLGELNTGLAGAVSGVLALSTGADAALAGGQDLTAGLGALDAGAGEVAAGSEDLAAGTGQVADGSSRLAAGARKVDGGVGTLGDGSQQLADGSSELAAGAGRAAAGSQELTAGAVRLAAGIGLAADGSQELAEGLGDAAEGSQELAEGIGDAADGSQQLAEGLGTAADGAPRLVTGAQRLSDEGAKVLVEKGEETAQSYGQMYASLVAGAERAETEEMAYGAPRGAEGLTAYSFVLRGEDGAGGRNLGRGLLAGGALALAGGGLLVRRRLLV